MNTDQIVQWLLEHYGQENFRPGLERMSEAISSLRSSLKKSRIVTIAGTNGKGETTLRLSQALGDRSQCVWISPHIERITERFRSEAGEIDEQLLWELIQRGHKLVNDKNYQLSFYEFLFLVFCLWASERGPEFLLLEVGMGGRLDAVNVLDASCVLLPSISRDHQEFLGRRYDLILREKLALLRAGSTLISFLSLNYLQERAESYCQEVGADHLNLGQSYDLGAWDFSRRNYLLAHAAYSFICSKNSHQLSVPENLPPLEHRGEIWNERGEWIFFGSHNPDGLRKLILFLHSGNYNFSRPPYFRVIAAFSRRDEKDLVAMLKMLKHSQLGRVLVTTFSHSKAASNAQMEVLCRQEGLDFVDGFENCVPAENNGPCLVLGSYYFMGRMQLFLRGHG